MPARALRPGDIAVAIFAVAVAGFMLVRSFPVSDELWRDLLHDRNGHYAFGLKLALHVRDRLYVIARMRHQDLGVLLKAGHNGAHQS